MDVLSPPTRFSRWTTTGVIGWVTALIAASAGPLRWNLDYLRSGSSYFSWYAGALILLLVFLVAYVWVRERSPALRRVEIAGFAALFLAVYLVRAPAATLLALWLTLISFSAGRVVLGRLRVQVDSAIERLALWPAAGLGLLSAILFVLGELQLYRRWLLFLALGLATWVFRRHVRALVSDLRRAHAGAVQADVLAGPLMGICLVFLVVSTAMSALLVLSPETSFDPIATHLYEARFYAETHRFQPPPDLSYHYFPKNVEMMQTLGFVLDSQPAAQVLGYLYTILALAAVFILARRWFSLRGAVLAAALTFTMPLVLFDGSVAKNDLGMALYQVLSLYAFLRWKEERNPAWARAMALFLGLSFGVKHTALVGFLPLSLLILSTVWKQSPTWRQRLLQCLVLAAVAAAAGAFWHVRTFVLTGNAVYPMEGFQNVARPAVPKRLIHYLRTPYEMLYRPRYRLPESTSPNPLGFALPALLPFLFFRSGKRRPAAWVLLFCAGGSFLFWVRSAENLRFLIPSLMVVLIVLSDRSFSFYTRAGRAARGAFLAAAAYCFFFALNVSAVQVLNTARLQYLFGQLDKDRYLEQTLSVYPALSFLNRAGRPGERVYAVATCARLYSKLPLACHMERLSDSSERAMAADLAAGAYQYLLIPAARAARLPPELRSRPLYQDDQFQVFRAGAR